MDEILHYMYNPEAKWICCTLINALGHARQRTIVTQGTKIHSISRNTIKKEIKSLGPVYRKSR